MRCKWYSLKLSIISIGTAWCLEAMIWYLSMWNSRVLKLNQISCEFFEEKTKWWKVAEDIDQNYQFDLKLIIWSIVCRKSFDNALFFDKKQRYWLDFFLFQKLRSRLGSLGHRDWTNWAQLRDTKKRQHKMVRIQLQQCVHTISEVHHEI